MATENTTSQVLYSHLFEACNILRGPINQDEYKSYVTPILFLKDYQMFTMKRLSVLWMSLMAMKNMLRFRRITAL